MFPGVKGVISKKRNRLPFFRSDSLNTEGLRKYRVKTSFFVEISEFSLVDKVLNKMLISITYNQKCNLRITN